MWVVQIKLGNLDRVLLGEARKQSPQQEAYFGSTTEHETCGYSISYTAVPQPRRSCLLYVLPSTYLYISLRSVPNIAAKLCTAIVLYSQPVKTEAK